MEFGVNYRKFTQNSKLNNARNYEHNYQSTNIILSVLFRNCMDLSWIVIGARLPMTPKEFLVGPGSTFLTKSKAHPLS